ncbi:conserved hypothetical protein [Rhodococcus jostii RHA1]|uniref:Uncharacterized protein n=1 Tax=Rhodococcus jostii (strain RHA1) TaxID=101510 RepID=Q0SED9_RHOJR|nr:hypothetical protein [Rhodococcus jostii]ABG94097.1 conserved hypothetical protein [Rhodococcus jostii RHA1]
MVSAESIVYIVDEMVVEPGRARAFLADYLERYVPGAIARGLTLDRVLVSPPVWLEDQSNTLTVSWTLRGVRAWWQQSLLARHDAEVLRWWADADEFLTTRRRTVSCSPADVEAMTDV